MARDDEKRKSFWDESEVDSIAKKLESKRPPKPEKLDASTIDTKIQDSRALMEQTHQLYQHYFNGIEKRPPIEKYRLLESKIGELQRVAASNTASKFKVNQFIQLYQTFKELWDRKLKEKERV